MNNLYQTWTIGGSGYAVLQDKQVVENRRFNNDSVTEGPSVFKVSHIDGLIKEYEFEEGMTWRDFCNSKYNPGEWYAEGGWVYTYSYSAGDGPWDPYEYRWICIDQGLSAGNDLIIADFIYDEFFESRGGGL